MKNNTGLRAFISYAARYKGAFWFTATLFAVANVAIAVMPWLIGQLTGSLTSHKDIVLWTVLVIASSVSHNYLWRMSEFAYLKLILPPAHRFNNVVFDAVITQPYGYFVDKFTGKISSYTTTLGREYRELTDEFFYHHISLVVGMPIIAITMFTVNAYTGIIFAVSILLMTVFGRPLARKAAKAERLEADLRSTLDGHVVDTVANFVSVKAFGNERREMTAIHEERTTATNAAAYAYKRAIMFWATMSVFVRIVIWGSTFVLNVYLYAHGKLSLSQMTTFLAAIVVFSSYIWDVVWYVSQINIRMARLSEAYTYLFGTSNICKEIATANIEPTKPFAHSLKLQHVSFAYPDKPNVSVLHDINLHIKNGEKIGIVGPSGGGKSTLTKLLLGYYPIVSGQLLLDGKPTDNRALTGITAYVPQDTAVFHRSIRDNIAYGKHGATEDQIVAAAKHAQAHDFIIELDEGYDTLVGERGIKLSGGQRQRVAIARAILKDAPLLMLDEATSALDSASEKLIQAALWDLMKDRTAIVIAHRLSTIQKMDRIVVMDNGRITEEGRHEDLLQRGGTYATLWAHQSGGFIEE